MLAVTVFGVYAPGGELPGVRQRCRELISRAVDKCFELDTQCYLKIAEIHSRTADAIENTIDRLPKPVAQLVRKVGGAMADLSTGRQTKVLGELLTNLHEYKGSYRVYYNLAALRTHARYAWPYHTADLLLDDQAETRRLELAKIDRAVEPSLPGWKADKEIWLLRVEHNVSLYSAEGNLPKIYVPGSVVVIKGELVIGALSLSGLPEFRAIR